MAVDQSDPFSVVLSRYRVAAGLTQEELAERAGLSSDAISTLERGVRTRPRPDTVRRLVEALALSSDDRVLFEQAARATPAEPPQEETLPVGEFLGAVPAGALIGREENGDRCRAALDAVGQGIGHLLLLTGEAGIGKTRLLQELTVEARSRGYLVLTGRCAASDQGRSYSPFAHVLGRLAGSPPPSVRADVQRQVKPIRHLMDTEPNGDGLQPRRGVATQEQLVSAVSDLLILVARSAPVVLVLDDLQWADVESLRLLEYLAQTVRTSRVLIAAAIRDTHLSEEHPALAHSVQQLTRERLAERLVVRRLSLEETTELVGTLMGDQAVSEDFASFVYRRTKGIPRLIDQLVRSLGGRLELQGEIGAGSMGRVFRAFDRERGEEVAAKLVLARQEIDLDTLLRFQQEGAVLSKLEHPGIVRIYDTFAEEHASCIVMELLPGRSLGQVLRDGRLPLNRAKHLGFQVAEALSYAHGQSIVHRDIKPDNVMVLDRDQVKVTDFGIARILQPDTSLQTIATTGMRMGTPLYMAPEQIEGKKIDGRTDLYALGAMLYHMVTGRPPFEGNDALTVAVKHLQEEPIPPSRVEPTVPEEWDAVILKALAKDPKHRYTSAGEMQRAIESLPLEPARSQASRSMRGTMLATIAAAAASVTAAIVALALVWPPFTAGQGQSSLQRKLDGYLTSLANQHQLSGTVLVAQKGKIILAKGYGMANRSRKIPNGPNTVYPSGVLSGILAIIAGLKLETQGILHSHDHVCSYLSPCPRSWKPMTVGMVLGGTSGLPQFSWGMPGRTLALELSTCEQEPLTAVPGSGTVNYQNCGGPVLGTIIQKATGQPFATVMRRLILAPAGMRHTGLLVDQHYPAGLADDYSGADPGQGGGYNGLFLLFTTAGDVHRLDNALFGGRILSPISLNRLFALRDPVTPPDPGIQGDSWGYKWKTGTAFGHQVVYTNGRAYSFWAADMRFPGDGVTIIVMSNDDQNDVLGVATHVAANVFGAPIVAPSQALAPAVSPSKAIVATVTAPPGFGLAAVSHGTFWLAGDQMGMVTRFDPATNKTVAHIKITDPSSKHPKLIDAGIVRLVTGSGEVWALDRANKEAVRIDPQTNRIVTRLPLGIEPSGGAISGQTLWVTTGQDEPTADTVVKIDLRREKVVARITNAQTSVGELYLSPTAGSDALWYVDWSRSIVKRLNAETNKVIAAVTTSFDPQPAVAVADGQTVWVTSHFLDRVTRIDARTNTVSASIPLTGYPTGTPGTDCCDGVLAVGAGAVWTIAGSGSRTLVRIDPRTERVTASLTFSQPIGTVAYLNGSVWVESPDTFYRIDPAAVKGT